MGPTLEISSLAEATNTAALTFKGTLNHAPIRILIDSGAMGNFVSQQAVDHFSFSLKSVPSIPIVFMNGAKGVCNKAIPAAYLCFQDHEERIDLRVVSLPNHDIILGKPWLEKWNPSINWRTHQITFPTLEQSPTITETETPDKPTLTLISYQQFTQSQDPEDQVFLCELSEEGRIYSNADDPRVKPLLQEYQDVFPDELPLTLPPSRPVDHRIQLEPGSQPPWRPIY